MAYKALSASITWAQQFNFNRNLALGSGSEPAVSSANIIKQTILGPPFSWPWNRDVITFTCTGSTQDYAETVADFGFVEQAAVQDINSVNTKWTELTNKICLPVASETALPEYIAAQTDSGTGTITFRLQPVPDAAYPVSVTVQKACVDFTAIGDDWGPIPNRYSYIYNWGFLALMYLYADDPRFQITNQKFVANLLGAAQGLTQTQVNIFLANWQQITGTEIANQGQLAQGTQSRAL
jgi:hypothetical protein